MQQFPYLPHTKEEREEMLQKIGVRSFEELIKQIPPEVRVAELDVPAGMNEIELSKHIATLAAKNKPASAQSSFLGGGSYYRWVPAALPTLVGRSEFATAYTPYQPEVSQGTLQAIYEFQSAICLLTEMEVANASIYDGPTACAEAALMSVRLTERNKVAVADNLNPQYRQVLKTYLNSSGLEYFEICCQNGLINVKDLNLSSDTAAVVVQYPNYFGCLENLSELESQIHKTGALIIVVSDPISLGLLEPPGKFGADMVVGDAQPCGNYLSFGGPSAGYLATRTRFVRQMPGRLVGITVDDRGQRAFTLTLQTREQHIRRARATSNICTNQALNALSMLVYLTLLGPKGLQEVAEVSSRRAHYLAEKLTGIKGVEIKFKVPFFSEFVLALKAPVAQILSELKDRGILGGIELGRYYPQLSDCLLISVTEMNGLQEIDNFVMMLAESLQKKAGNVSVAKVAQVA